ncbi:MAG: HYR domain-containing protein, partial [Candidatus Binataceae bacterium]
PELAGVCGTGACGPGNTCPGGQTCDSTGICRNGATQQRCDFATTTCSAAGDTCQLWGGGTPKYGDYNGSACAVGHLYNVWASATPARTTNPAIDLFFKVHDTVEPTANCQNVTVPTDPNLCSAATASIDNGSTDSDGDTFTLSQAPPGPYNKGTDPVTLTITDQNGQSASCNADVIVVDEQPPNISCPSPVVECTSPAGASVPLNPVVSDNCPGVGTPACVPPSGSTFPIGSTPFSCKVSDASMNMNSCTSAVKVQDTMPPVISAVVASPNVLWPPDGKLRPVSVSVSVHDTCDLNPVCTITSITANEPITAEDAQITGPLTANLQARRKGNGDGRIYTLTVTCTDASHNRSSATATVTVPHDQGN